METSRDRFYFQQNKEDHEENRKRLVVRRSLRNPKWGIQSLARASHQLHHSLRSPQISPNCWSTPVNFETTRVFEQHISVCARLYFCSDCGDCDYCDCLCKRQVDAQLNCEVPLCNSWSHCLRFSRNCSECYPSYPSSRQESACHRSKHQSRSSPSSCRKCRTNRAKLISAKFEQYMLHLSAFRRKHA